MPWFLDLVQLSTEIPLQLLVSTTLLKQSHTCVLHSKPRHLNLSTWCLGVDSSKNKASLWRWQRELLPLKDHQPGPSTSQSGPYLRNGAEKIRWTSPLPLKQVSDFLCTYTKFETGALQMFMVTGRPSLTPWDQLGTIFPNLRS